MVAELVWILALLAIGGVLGGYLGGPQASWGRRDEPESPNEVGKRKWRIRPTKWEKFFHGIRPALAGLGGAVVAVTFAAGPIAIEYNEIVGGDPKTLEKFVGGVIKLLAVSVLGGYLGVRLIEKFAEQLLAQKIERMVGTLDSVREEVDVERIVRESERSLREGFPGAAWDHLKDLPRGDISPDDMANLRVLRGYALKRLGRVDEARLEVQESLRTKPTFAGWYNKACYAALGMPEGSVADEVRGALEEAVRLAQLQQGGAAIRRNLMEDTKLGGDLHAFRNADFVRQMIGDADNPDTQ